MVMLKKVIVISALVVAGLAFLKFGRSIYMPIVREFMPKETIESVISKIEMEARSRLQTNLEVAGYPFSYPKMITLVGFKEEKMLQVYCEDSTGCKLIKTYPFTAYAGKLGPKLKNGDKQIPEGIYEVEYLNPNSSYYLSIKVNYPNQLDRKKSRFTDVSQMGGDIFIHGKSATIGCIPIGDEAIEEVFLMTSKANNRKAKIIISPRDFRSNPVYPQIDEIDWETELYDMIYTELKKLPHQVLDFQGHQH